MNQASGNDSIPPADNPPPRRRLARALPDLASLLGENQKPSEEAAKQDARPRRKANLSALFDLTGGESKQESKPEPVSEEKATQDGLEAGGEEQVLTIPPEFEKYLPPDLWRKLTGGAPRRGVLINALERLRSIQFLLRTFLPSHIYQEKMRHPIPGLVEGQTLNGSLLFADVSGFTALSERLAVLGRKGAEDLTTYINDYFSTMLEILSWSGGILLKFAGDANLVYFPEQEGGEQANWAVRAGMRMLDAIQKFSNIQTPTGVVSLRMKIGVATGEFLSASVGSAQRMEYAVLGPVITQTMGAEGAASGPGELIANDATLALLGKEYTFKPQAPGYSLIEVGEFEELGSFEIKAEERRVRGSIALDASPKALIAEMEETLQKIRAMEPYIARELVERFIAHAREREMASQFLFATVLFCNFTGFETLYDVWGHEGEQRVTSMISAYFNAMNEAISRYGGIVSRIDPYSKGTKLLALFGAPVNHEDDPQRAASAALAMNIELDALNERWQNRYARNLPADFEVPLVRHRIGITQGNTYAGLVGSMTRREYTVMGDDVNLSARLMSAAKPGQILVSQNICQSISAYFVTTELPAIRVKGKSKPISVFQVDGPRDDALSNRVYKRDELIGRPRELAQGKRILQQVLQGHGTYLTLFGPAGMGKSHLADNILQQAAKEGARLLLYQCRSYKPDVSFACWSGLLHSLASITSTDTSQVQRDKLQRLMAEIDLPKGYTKIFEAILGISFSVAPQSIQPRPVSETGPGEDTIAELVKQGRTITRRGSGAGYWKQLDKNVPTELGQTFLTTSTLTQREHDQFFEAISDMLARLSSQTPLVIFFEDAHWMDAASRQLMMQLREAITDKHILILTAQRGDPGEKMQLGEKIAVGPFSPSETTNMVSHILVSGLAEIIHQQTQGNPLLIEEISRWIQKTQKIGVDDLKGILQSSDILYKLVLSSLEALSENQREIARTASVIGEEFRVGELQALLGEAIDPMTLSNHLSVLAESGLIALCEAGIDARYAFSQTYVRDVLYNSMPFARRRELHGLLADYLSAPRSQRSEVHTKLAALFETGEVTNPAHDAEVVASHYELAEQWAAGSQSLLRSAVLYGEQKNYEKAKACLLQALADLERLPADEVTSRWKPLKTQLHEGLGDILLLSGDYAASLPNYEAARAGQPEDILPSEAVGLIKKCALILPTQGRIEEAENLICQATGMEELERDIGLHAILAWLLWRANRPEVKEQIRRCKSLLSSAKGQWVTGIEILMNDMAGEWNVAKAAFQAYGQPIGSALAATRFGDQFLSKGDVHSANNQYDFAAKVWKNTDYASCGLALVNYRQAEMHWQMGETATCLAALEEAQALLRQCLPAIQIEARDLIKKAIKMVKSENHAAWPTWQWQAIDDAFRIGLLFGI
jgi:class 3 adenylate cyclase/tetratricopeptide (TPR) repeat protein